MREKYNPLEKEVKRPENIKREKLAEEHLSGAEPAGAERAKSWEGEKAEGKAETMLRQFLALSRLYWILESWKPEDFKTIEMNERMNREMGKKEAEDLAKEIQEVRGKLAEVLQKAEEVLRSLLDSSALKDLFKKSLGCEINSLTEAENMAGELLSPFYETYQRNLPQSEGSTQTKLDARYGRDVAWSITGISTLALPEEQDLTAEERNRNRLKRKADWGNLVDKLRALPGSHQDAIENYFDPAQSQGKSAVDIIESFLGMPARAEEMTDAEKQDRAEIGLRVSKLEIYTREDLARLNDQLEETERWIAAYYDFSEEYDKKKANDMKHKIRNNEQEAESKKTKREPLIEDQQYEFGELSPEQMKVFSEIFGEGNLIEVQMPTPEELTDEYFDRYYPASQKEEDTERGLISFRPNWWDQVADKSIVGGDETWGEAYIRSMRAEAEKQKGRKFLVEKTPKPKYRDGSQLYGTIEGVEAGRDPLQEFFQKALTKNANRYNHNWDQDMSVADKIKEEVIGKFFKKGIAVPDFEIVCLPAVLANRLMTEKFPNNSATNTSEWTSTPLLKQDGTDSGRRLLAGDSANGGASYVDNSLRGVSWSLGGVRFAVMLK